MLQASRKHHDLMSVIVRENGQTELRLFLASLTLFVFE